MEFDGNLPIYMQIMNLLKAKVVSGEIHGGDKLPSVRDLSKELKVNPNTIQRAYQELEREELVFTMRGMGTFVTKDLETIRILKKNMATGLIDRFLLEMKELGFHQEEIKELILDRIEREEKE